MTLGVVKRLLSEQINVDEDTVRMDTRFDDLGVESVEMVELVMALEAEFEMQLGDDQLERVQTVGDLVRLIEESE